MLKRNEGQQKGYIEIQAIDLKQIIELVISMQGKLKVIYPVELEKIIQLERKNKKI